MRLRTLSKTLLLNLLIFSVLVQASCLPVVDYGLSAKKYQQAIELVDQGTTDLRANRLEEAEGAFAAASEISPIAAAFDGLGCVALMRQDFSLAERYFVYSYQVDPDYINSLGNLALLYEIAGLSESAARTYKMAIQAAPENFRIRNNFAVFLFSKEAKTEAKNQLLKAFALAKHPVVATNVIKFKEYE